MKVRRVVMLFAAAMLSTAMMAGCSNETRETPADFDAGKTEEEEENYDTGDASLDNPRNQDGIGENELLAVSFGTSYNDSRRLTIGAIEASMEEAFPEYSVRRGFTSQIIIDHIEERDHVSIDNVKQALDRAAANGVKNLVIQPTHLMDGLEYSDLVREAAEYSGAFEKMAVGEPLLTSDEDFQAVIGAVTGDTAQYDDGETAVCLMGHGTEAESNRVYRKLQDMLAEAGFQNYFVGTVEAEPGLEDVLAAVKAGSYKRVVLQPLMIVAGDHANNDMAGDGEDSWKTSFEKAGYEVVCRVRGLGEMEEVRRLFVEHAQAAMDRLTETSGRAAGSLAAETGAAGNQISGRETSGAARLKDGTYDVTVESSSSMFQITSCRLTVKDGAMSAVLTMGGTGYLRLYMGTGGEAAKAPESDYIPFAVDGKGRHTFEIPVKALDQEIACSAYSKKKEKWYDRQLVFRSDSLPSDAFEEEGRTAESLKLEDGLYRVEVTLEGGSGKASVQSPAALRIEDGKASASIVWSSDSYDYMKAGGEKILWDGSGEFSTFEIPVPCFDRKIAVAANTIAMSEPHEIQYTLFFDCATIQKAD